MKSMKDLGWFDPPTILNRANAVGKIVELWREAEEKAVRYAAQHARYPLSYTSGLVTHWESQTLAYERALDALGFTPQEWAKIKPRSESGGAT